MTIPTITPYKISDTAELPKNSVSWETDPKRSVLLIHDMQQYFMNFFQLGTSPVTELIENIQRLKKVCTAAGIPVVYTGQPGSQQPSDRGLLTDFWGPGPRRKPNQTEIVADLKPDGDDIFYTKWRYSAFKRTPLAQYLKTEDRDQLLICGIYAHIGILSTALEAFMLDIQPMVVADAVADFSFDDQQMALGYIARRCGYITSTEQVETALRPSVASSAKDLADREPGLTLDHIRQDVAEILTIDLAEIDPDEDVTVLGLDSIRLISLVESWQGRGASTTFADLNELATLRQWSESLQSKSTKQTR